MAVPELAEDQVVMEFSQQYMGEGTVFTGGQGVFIRDIVYSYSCFLAVGSKAGVDYTPYTILFS